MCFCTVEQDVNISIGRMIFVSDLSHEPNIGIFWLVKENGKIVFLVDKVPASQGDCHENMTTWGEHYNFWEQCRSKNKKKIPSRVPMWSEYEEWPRGRVVYDVGAQLFTVYADRKLLTKTMRVAISEEFCLPLLKTRYSSDAHYISIRKL
ncbi:hypothetical protein NBRC3279_0141 [Acetobacter pasteurianus NBRC 3279]|nr:hypothetical protein NBRC3279_0141 [Acetobacter pasteurianus NBRC 3279]GCD70983.1 hypothetical protein NBRC3284_0139 [Acetobacter pasteurianus NBRC 3284]